MFRIYSTKVKNIYYSKRNKSTFSHNNFNTLMEKLLQYIPRKYLDQTQFVVEKIIDLYNSKKMAKSSVGIKKTKIKNKRKSVENDYKRTVNIFSNGDDS